MEPDMPYYQFTIDEGASEDEVINAPDLRSAWKQLPDRFEDEDLAELKVEFMGEVTMPPGFEDGEEDGGKEEGSRS
jgi:hypothetical protein